MAKLFDRNLGVEFVAALPNTPGVYRIYNLENALIYVGKAKNLRRRLSQYRNAKRRKKHAKMRAIVREAVRIEIDHWSTDLEACLAEMRLIQEHRPKWNVEGAFYFLYPMIGMRDEGMGVVSFCYTMNPGDFQDFSMHGAYRSRGLTGEAFFSWMRLMGFVGHRDKKRGHLGPKTLGKSYVYRYRQVPSGWCALWNAFFTGESQQALEVLVLALVENAKARSTPDQIQEHLDHLKRFWRHEARLLARMRKETGHFQYPVSQIERDLLALRYRHARRAGGGTKLLQSSLFPSSLMSNESEDPHVWLRQSE